MKRLLGTILLSVAAMTAGAQQPDYLNAQLSAGQRTEDLMRRLTLDEKIQLMMNSSRAIDRLGIPQWEWWAEGLHGAGRNGISTVFPQCIGMASSFDDALLYRIYTATSDEMRAKFNDMLNRGKAPQRYQGISVWTPNVNIFRDPRWGRGQETYGEDPYLTSRMGVAVVRGLQGARADGTRIDGTYYKLMACAKHFAVHSGPEKTRHHLDIEDLPARDLYETYLPAFRHLVQQGDVQEVMCAYQRFEGQPCCGSNRLLQQILRNEWGFKGLVVSDCGAIGDFWRQGHHETDKTPQAASAHGVMAGTDVECGSTYRSLPQAVKEGLISEAQIDTSVRRLLKARFELGDMTPAQLVPWRSIGTEVIASREHRDLALQMAREQTVLLQNRNNLLPLRRDARIMVMGPNAADSVMLWGIYYGQPTHTVTLREGLNAVAGRTLPYAQGCSLTEMTEKVELFSRFSHDGRQGMKAQFWNSRDMQGEPVLTKMCTTKLDYDNGGNTVFERGVNLSGFSARFVGTLRLDREADVSLSLMANDATRLLVNGDTIYNNWRENRLSDRDQTVHLDANKDYEIQLDYMSVGEAASLHFDASLNRSITAAEVVRQARDADIVVFVGGISPVLEREEANVSAPGFDNGDRTSIELPEAQRRVLRALHEAGKKIVLVNCSGSAVGLVPETETCDAIVQGWYAGEQGGRGIAEVIFGDYNPSGKLPVTFYKDDSQIPADFEDYHMQNRTYRFFRGEPLYPFGYGLSYTSFSYGRPTVQRATIGRGQSLTVTVPVKNVGQRDGTEIVQLYLRRPGDTDGPLKSLRAFARQDIKAGQTASVSLTVPYEDFEWWDKTTNTMRPLPGRYEVLVGCDSRDSSLQRLTVNLK
jgi:beta-glucosidase